MLIINHLGILLVLSVMIDIVRGELIDCYQCTTLDEESCLEISDETPIITCKENEVCYADLDTDGFVRRGCSVPNDKPDTCPEALCNSQLIQLECVSCVGSECATHFTAYNTQLCPLSRQQQCYVFQGAATISRGCFTDDLQCTYGVCSKCSASSRCNDEKLYSCWSCDESFQGDCRENPAQLCFNTNPICFTCQTSADKLFYRGCSQLTDGTCETCAADQDGANCNSGIHQCYSCVGCNKIIGDEHVVNCDIGANCVTYVNEYNLTTRGCDTETSRCVDDDPDCVSCSGEKCNVQMLPKDQLHCHQCRYTQECKEEQQSESGKPCAPDATQCYMYVNDNNQAIRGCDTDEDFDNCRRHSDSCRISDFENNNAVAIHLNFSCVRCGKDETCTGSSDEFRNCRYLFHQTPQCFLERPGGSNDVLIRGCANDDNSCSPTNLDECEYCDEDKCNAAAVTNQKCIVCNSDQDFDCGNTIDQPTPVECGEPSAPIKKNGCYVKVDGTTVSRGCVSSLPDEDICLDEESPSCHLCFEDGCNKDLPPIISCLNCVSNDPTDDCAQARIESVPTVLCPGSNSCVTTVVDGKTTRQCAKSPQQCNNSDAKECFLCNGSECNKELLQRDQMHCLRCSNSEDCDQEPDQIALQHCTSMVYDDKCFVYFDSITSHIVRGCKSDSDYSTYCLLSSDCLEYNTWGGNGMALYNSILHCSECAGTEECKWSQDPVNFVDLKLKFYETGGCYSKIDEDGNVERGSFVQNPPCVLNVMSCEICSTDGCNAFSMKKQQCIQCSEEDNDNCADYPEKITATDCTNTYQPIELKGCYTYTSGGNANSKVYRGCAIDLGNGNDTKGAMKRCVNDPGCSLCTDDGCNNKTPPQPNGNGQEDPKPTDSPEPVFSETPTTVNGGISVDTFSSIMVIITAYFLSL